MLKSLSFGDEVRWFYTGCSLQPTQKRHTLMITGSFVLNTCTSRLQLMPVLPISLFSRRVQQIAFVW